MFERSDRRNQQALQKHNETEKPVITDWGVRLMTWPAYAMIAVILVSIVVVFAYQVIAG